MHRDYPDIFLTNITRGKNCQQRQCYRVRDIIAKVDVIVLEYLLFAHAFTGCDTTSAVHKFGKISVFEKLKSSSLRNVADVFYEDDVSPDQVGRASIRFFELLNSSTYTLSQIRKQKYEEMVMSNRSHVDPALLPPSPRTAYHHGLRVYHQLKVWRTLSNSDLKPLSWGWQKKDDMFSPVMTDVAAAPEDVLKIIRCSCKGSCNRRCSCRKAGLTCTSSCKECCGMTCTNTTVVFDDELGEEERHFMDAFA
ncbi:unnamed protein product [Clavelina lepadiformis]|uniref:Tesmin/TSO1-like CXC domain-containing protein n=1 Tax=Clavelina lepadiformis TaxID=159417 RepID=A0ABP0GF14_CLALP